MRAILAAGLLLTLTACGRDAPAVQQSPAGLAKEIPHDLPDTQPRFVGRWAAAEEGCHAEAWLFRRDGLVTPGHTACTFRNVRAAPGGYDIDAICTADRPTANYTLQIRFAESAGAMLVDGGPMAPVSLIACDSG
jgi:hypothetical protein